MKRLTVWRWEILELPCNHLFKIHKLLSVTWTHFLGTYFKHGDISSVHSSNTETFPRYILQTRRYFLSTYFKHTIVLLFFQKLNKKIGDSFSRALRENNTDCFIKATQYLLPIVQKFEGSAEMNAQHKIIIQAVVPRKLIELFTTIVQDTVCYFYRLLSSLHILG